MIFIRERIGSVVDTLEIKYALADPLVMTKLNVFDARCKVLRLFDKDVRKDTSAEEIITKELGEIIFKGTVQRKLKRVIDGINRIVPLVFSFTFKQTCSLNSKKTISVA